MAPSLPAVLGNGVGGVVVSVGPGVDPVLVRRRVVTTTGGSGGYAEMVAVDADGLIDVPGELRLVEAVALLADGRTAVALIERAGLQEGETVLVEAAAGGVGSLLVQLAESAGGRVVAAAGGQRKVLVAEELGASVAVDYSTPGWSEHVRAQVGAVDVVFDGVGGEIGREAFGLLRDGGRCLLYGMSSGAFTKVPDEEAARRRITVLRGTPLSPQEMGDLTRLALVEAAAGRLRAVVGQTFPLAQAAEAHAAIAARSTIGKTLLLARPVTDRSAVGHPSEVPARPYGESWTGYGDPALR